MCITCSHIVYVCMFACMYKPGTGVAFPLLHWLCAWLILSLTHHLLHGRVPSSFWLHLRTWGKFSNKIEMGHVPWPVLLVSLGERWVRVSGTVCPFRLYVGVELDDRATELHLLPSYEPSPHSSCMKACPVSLLVVVPAFLLFRSTTSWRILFFCGFINFLKADGFSWLTGWRLICGSHATMAVIWGSLRHSVLCRHVYLEDSVSNFQYPVRRSFRHHFSYSEHALPVILEPQICAHTQVNGYCLLYTVWCNILSLLLTRREKLYCSGLAATVGSTWGTELTAETIPTTSGCAWRLLRTDWTE